VVRSSGGGHKKKLFFPVGITNRDKMVSFVPVARSGTKGFPLLSRHGVSGWETGTKKVSQPGQIKVFVVVDSHNSASFSGELDVDPACKVGITHFYCYDRLYMRFLVLFSI